MKGVNYPYAGATAIELNYFKNRIGVQELATNNSLNVQFEWFKNIKLSLCKSEEGFVLTTCVLFLQQRHEFPLYNKHNFYVVVNTQSVITSSKKH